MTAQTVVDDVDRTFLVLRVAAALDDSAGDGCGTRWCAHVCDPASPLAGLYAFADSLADARDAVAVLAWTAVMAGELLPFGLSADDLAGVHVAVTTSTAYDALWLTAAVANDAA
ncbi:MAG TPA: hypothetical protein VGX28_02080 [Frankiaceae bacterium]|jgi:hypothetical protein|nr:hypothetical protein [Frankiaceae bacterium]